MAIIHMEGFDLVGVGENSDLVAKGGYNNIVGTITTTGGKFGGGGLTVTGVSQGLSWSSSTFLEYITMSCWVKTGSSIVSSVSMFACSDTDGDTTLNVADAHFNCGFTANGSWVMGGDSGANRATSATGLVATDTWYHVEIQVQVATSGTATLYVDGEVMLAATAGDYREGATDMTFFLIGQSTGTTFDDLVIQGDAGALPAVLDPHRIETLLPDGNTAQADFTGAFGDIDDALGGVHDGDTTNINSATLNDKSEFAMEALVESPTTIFAIQTVMASSKTDSGSKAVTPYLVSNSTRDDGAEFNPADGSYLYTTDIFEEDPDISGAWTETTVNAVLFGVEVTT